MTPRPDPHHIGDTFPLVYLRESRWRKLPEDLRIKGLVRQALYRLGFHLDACLELSIASKWQSLSYPSERSNEAIDQWVEHVYLWQLGRFTWAEKLEDVLQIEVDYKHDLELLRQCWPELFANDEARDRRPLDVRAVGVFLEHRDWTKRKIAKHLNCGEKSLCPGRCPQLAYAIKAHRDSRVPARGTKDKHGNLEAYKD